MSNISGQRYARALALAGAVWTLACPATPPPPPTTPPAPVAAPTTPPTPSVVPAAAPGGMPGGVLAVDPTAGRNNFTAVFDAPLGERITAESSAVECAVTFDERANTMSGQCSVALPTIMVDSDATKTDHFQQWMTNKKSEPATCRLEARFEDVKLAQPLMPGVPTRFATDVPFTVCGRSRVDGGREHVEGTIALLPRDENNPSRTLRVRAQIEGFSRERYHIGPAWTDGWLARVQKYANVVADQGTIVLSLFAQGRE